MLMTDSIALAVGPVVGSRRRTAVQRARVSLDRRLWDLEEVTEILNRGLIDGCRPRYSIDTIRGWVARGELPVIVLPAAWASDKGRPGWKTYRVPDIWVENWFAMRDRSEPVFTTRKDIGSAADPPWVTLNDAGLAIGISHETMGEMVKLGIVEAHKEPSGTQVVSVRTLDDWIFRLVRQAEEEWYGREVASA